MSNFDIIVQKIELYYSNTASNSLFFKKSNEPQIQNDVLKCLLETTLNILGDITKEDFSPSIISTLDKIIDYKHGN